MNKDELFAEEFFKKMMTFDKTCISCKFFVTTTNQCKKHNIIVDSKTPKCDKWRYGC